MAMIGIIGAYFEHQFGRVAGASGPIADAYHLGNDALSDLVVLHIPFLVWFFPHKKSGFKRKCAYIQVGLLAIAALLILTECVLKVVDPKEIDAYTMMLAGAIGFVSNLVRFLILQARIGSWDINRLIQNKHVKSDLFYSIGVIVASGLKHLSGWPGWDWVILFIIFFLVSRLAFLALKDALRGNVELHTH